MTPTLLTQVQTDWFYLAAGSFQGSMMEFYAGLESRLSKRFGLGAAYDRFVVSAEQDTRDGFKADFNWNAVYLYVSAYVF